ncbi:hypothetical protein BHM03_00026936 [Ensete ventricosum]|nr:hypothetical protein BHM03_00026936 [Ensete ventricosum]
MRHSVNDSFPLVFLFILRPLFRSQSVGSPGMNEKKIRELSGDGELLQDFGKTVRCGLDVYFLAFVTPRQRYH